MREAGLAENVASRVLRQARVYVETEALLVATAGRLLQLDPVAHGVRRHVVVRTRDWAVLNGWSVSDLVRPERCVGVPLRSPYRRKGKVVTEEQFEQSRSEVVVELRPCGDAEQDHLLEEIQSPDSTEALYEMPGRCRPEAA